MKTKQQTTSNSNDNDLNITVEEMLNSELPEELKNIEKQYINPAEFEQDYRKIKKYINKMNEFDAKHFVAVHGDKSIVFMESIDIDGYHCLIPFTHKNFKEHYSNKFINVPDMLYETVSFLSLNLASHWLTHPRRRSYEGITFYPSFSLPAKYQHKRYFNKWKGFYVKSVEGDFSKLEYHLKKIWCRNNEKHYRYLMVWFADLVQHPERKAGVALVVKGNKGTGKSLIFENVFEKILGNMYLKIDKAEQVTGRFNKHQEGKLLLVLEEAIWAGDKNAEGTLKSMITDKQTILEQKGIDAVKIDSFIRLAFVSNEKQAVPATFDERRFFAIQSSDEKTGDSSYFKDLLDEIDNGGREAFMYYISNLEYSEDEIRQPPKTNILMEDIEAGMSSFERWLYTDLLQKDFYEFTENDSKMIWTDKIFINDLFAEYNYFIEYNRSKYIGRNDVTSQKKFTQLLYEYFNLSIKDKRRIKRKDTSMQSKEQHTSGDYFFYNLDKRKLRDAFASKIKTELTWNDEEDIKEEEIDALDYFTEMQNRLYR